MDKILFIMAVMASGIASPRPVNPDSIKTKTSKLGEIVVEASMQRTGAGVSTYYPDRNSRRTALNAIDLLNRMAIPQINVDPLGGSVRTPGGEDVAVFIDMERATPEEKDALRAEDVKKVEYFVFPSDPRFNHERYVINITLRHYEYGGYSKLSATGNIMAGSESGLAYAKMSYKRMTYDVNVTDKYTDRRNTGTERTQVFRFPSEDGKTEEITRSDILDYSRFRENQLGASVRAKYASDMAVISNSVYFTARNTPNSDTRGTLRLSTDLTGDKSYSNTCNSTYLYPRWVGNYYFNFGNDLKLNAIPSLFYQYTRSHRGYSSGETSILTDATEKAITGQLQFQISKTLHKYHSLNLNLMGLYYHNRVDYSGNTEASPVFRQFAYGGILSYSLGMERLYGQLAVAFAGESNKISGVTTNSLIPMCRLNMQYAFNQKNSISLTARYDVKAVGAADKTPDIIQENELLYKVGNVNLRNTTGRKPQPTIHACYPTGSPFLSSQDGEDSSTILFRFSILRVLTEECCAPSKTTATIRIYMPEHQSQPDCSTVASWSKPRRRCGLRGFQDSIPATPTILPSPLTPHIISGSCIARHSSPHPTENSRNIA